MMQNSKDILNAFANLKIVVVGDVMIDAYLEGKVNRISPEAPVPIVNFTNKENRLGGAANVALNLVSLGAKAMICSVIGKDSEGEELITLFEKHGIDSSGLVSSENRMTTVKTRVVGNNQQLLRVDREQTHDIAAKEELLLLEKIETILLGGCDAIILQDYNKGVLTENLIQRIIALANVNNVITTVDPKLKNFLNYKDVTLFKPNLKELREGLGISELNPKDKLALENAIATLQEKIDAKNVFITLSENGVFMYGDNQKIHHPAHRRNIADVSGAGDTVISVATLALAAGLDLGQVAAIANLAGGIVCEYPGVVAIDRERLALEMDKIL
jgi:rfaE bifunctional protein kinase chain/domain